MSDSAHHLLEKAVLECPMLEKLGLVPGHVGAVLAAGLRMDSPDVTEYAPLVHAAPTECTGLPQPACNQANKIVQSYNYRLHATSHVKN